MVDPAPSGVAQRLTGTARRLTRRGRRFTGRLVDRIRADKRPTPEPVPLSTPGLDELGRDRQLDASSFKHNYFRHYETLFAPWRHQAVQILTIGERNPAAAQVFEQWLGRARQIAVLRGRRAKSAAGERTRVLVGDPGDPEFLTRLAIEVRPHLVIDDGSHVWRHQIETLRALYPMVRPGGYFVIEDIHTSFGPVYAEKFGVDGSTTSAADYVARIAAAVAGGHHAEPLHDQFLTYARHTLDSVQFVHFAAILRKADFPQGTYVVRDVADLAERTWVHDTGGGYARIPATLLAAGEHVQQAFTTLYDAGPVEPAAAVSAELHDVRVVGAGVVIVGSSIVEETLNGVRNVSITAGLYQAVQDRVWVDASERPCEPVAPVPGKRPGLLKQTFDTNYGHWLVDTLPKVALAAETGDLDDVVFVVNDQESEGMRRVVEDSLALFGVTADQLLVLPRRNYSFERLTVLGTLTRHPVSKSPRAITVLEGLVDRVPRLPDAPTRIYVTRAGFGRRDVLNEAAVIEAVIARGYSVVAPHELTLAEQIATFAGATHVVGVMGAALSNLAFSPTGVSMLSLGTPAMAHDYFYDIVCLKRGRYRGLQGVSDDEVQNLSTDFTIDVALLEEALDWLEGTQP